MVKVGMASPAFRGFRPFSVQHQHRDSLRSSLRRCMAGPSLSSLPRSHAVLLREAGACMLAVLQGA